MHIKFFIEVAKKHVVENIFCKNELKTFPKKVPMELVHFPDQKTLIENYLIKLKEYPYLAEKTANSLAKTLANSKKYLLGIEMAVELVLADFEESLKGTPAFITNKMTHIVHREAMIEALKQCVKK